MNLRSCRNFIVDYTKYIDLQSIDLQAMILMLVASDFDLRIEPHPISQDTFNMHNPFAAEILKSGIEIEPDKPYKWFGEVL